MESQTPPLTQRRAAKFRLKLYWLSLLLSVEVRIIHLLREKEARLGLCSASTDQEMIELVWRKFLLKHQNTIRCANILRRRGGGIKKTTHVHKSYQHFNL